MIKKWIGKSLLALNGWSADASEDLLQSKQVIIGFPHTTNMDAVRSLALFASLEIPVHTLIKQEFFNGPTGVLLRRLGAIPVDRTKGTNMAQNLAREFQALDQFTLVLAPEGTRTKNGETPPIKTGFWQIAKAAQVPIVLMLSDSVSKRGTLIGRIYPSELEADLKQIAQLYAAHGVQLKLPEV